MSSESPMLNSKTPNPNIPGVFDVSIDEVNAQKNSLYLVDVRRPDEWVGEYGHIEGAELLTLDYLPQKIDELPKDKTIVFICRSGARSANATAFLLENGFTEVYNMKGGMMAWTAKNYATIEKNGA